MNRYIKEVEGTYYSDGELIAKLLNGLSEEINVLARDTDFTYIEDVEMQKQTYNLYCIIRDETRLASKIFLTFHTHKTLFGKNKLIVNINMTNDKNLFPYKIYKKLPSLVKKRVKSINSLPEFKGQIHRIKV